MANYPGTVPSFTAKSPGQTITAAGINAIADEVVAIGGGLLNGFAHNAIPDATANNRDLGSAGNEWRDLYLNGKIFIDTPRCAAFHNTTQSINNAVLTALNLNSEDFDVGTMHDTAVNNTRVTIPSGQGGLYLLIGQASFATNSTGVRSVAFRKNGTTTLSQVQVGADDGVSQSSVSHSHIVVLAAADYIELMAAQSSGGALNIGSASAELSNRLQVIRLW